MFKAIRDSASLAFGGGADQWLCYPQGSWDSF